MSDKLAACKARLIKAYTEMAEDFDLQANEAEYLNRRFEQPTDVEGFRVKAHAAREALRAVREDRPIEPRWQELLGLTKGTRT
jgi:hypothetical protein